MPALLRTRIREKIEAALAVGVPLNAAGSALGCQPKLVASWLRFGNSDTPLEKPTDPTKFVFFEKSSCTSAEWYEHHDECIKLARAVMRYEGALVAKLAARMWKRALGKDGFPGDPDMQKFLFKHYAHVHQLVERKQGMEVSTAPTDSAPRVVIYVPDNGRGPKPAATAGP